MNNTIKKWLPAIIICGIVILALLIGLIRGSKLPTFKFDDEKIVDKAKLDEIAKMLEDDNTKGNAKTKLDELYKDISKDDNYYLMSARITMATDNEVYAVSDLNYVENHNVEYYALMVKATAGQFFTMGEVPTALLDTAVEAASKYSDIADFPLLAGELYYDKDNYYAALYYLDKALLVDPENVDALYYYSLCTYILGDKDEAIKYMEKAKSNYKGDDKKLKSSMDNYISIMKEGKR